MKPEKEIFARSVLLAAVVFSLISAASAQWKEQVLYSFQGGTDGAFPNGGLIRDEAGNLYGVTTEGGSTACPPGWCGTVYELSPPAQKGGSWIETLIYVFKGHDQNDGSSPSGPLIADSAGNFYGTTGYEGSGPCVLLGRPDVAPCMNCHRQQKRAIRGPRLFCTTSRAATMAIFRLGLSYLIRKGICTEPLNSAGAKGRPATSSTVATVERFLSLVRHRPRAARGRRKSCTASRAGRMERFLTVA
jgi:hypothetical protein